LIPELICRLPVLTHLNPLDKKALLSILTEPKNALIKQYTKLFEYEGIELKFDKEVIDFIVDKASEFKLAARGLRSICEAIMLYAMFEITSTNEQSKDKTLHITLEYAKQKSAQADIKMLKLA